MPVPTPADLARRRPRLAAAPAAPPPGPHQLLAAPADGGWRRRFDRAVVHSHLSSHARLLALTLATLADPATATIPTGRTSLGRLAAATALRKEWVRMNLLALEAAGYTGRPAPRPITLAVPPAPPSPST